MSRASERCLEVFLSFLLYCSPDFWLSDCWGVCFFLLFLSLPTSSHSWSDSLVVSPTIFLLFVSDSAGLDVTWLVTFKDLEKRGVVWVKEKTSVLSQDGQDFLGERMSALKNHYHRLHIHTHVRLTTRYSLHVFDTPRGSPPPAFPERLQPSTAKTRLLGFQRPWRGILPI